MSLWGGSLVPVPALGPYDRGWCGSHRKALQAASIRPPLGQHWNIVVWVEVREAGGLRGVGEERAH